VEKVNNWRRLRTAFYEHQGGLTEESGESVPGSAEVFPVIRG
jgi:hypothetical protein